MPEPSELLEYILRDIALPKDILHLVEHRRMGGVELIGAEHAARARTGFGVEPCRVKWLTPASSSRFASQLSPAGAYG